MKKSFFLILLFSCVLHCQRFQLSDIYLIEFSIDKIGQEVYFKDFYSDSVRKVNLKDMSITNTGMRVSLPVFANKHHFMIYGNNSLYNDSNKNDIFIYNLYDSSYLNITDTIAYPNDFPFYSSFSPNDDYLVYPGFYMSFKDSLLKPFYILDAFYNDSNVNNWMEWSSDSSFVYLTNDRSNIVEYFMISERTDTLVRLEHEKITGFAINCVNGILAYSVSTLYTTPPSFDPGIYFHYLDNNSNNILFFDPKRDEPDNPFFWEPVELVSLTWSPDKSKLAFCCKTLTHSNSLIWMYDLDSNQVFSDEGNGLTYFHQWANNDTLIFADATDQHIYGLDFSSLDLTVDIRENVSNLNSFLLRNYPNPFNPTTTIKYSIPNCVGTLHAASVQLTVFNLLGQEIATLVNKYQSPGTYEVKWDASEYPSGVYFYTLFVNHKPFATRKLMLIK